jgi:hypothetical protein
VLAILGVLLLGVIYRSAFTVAPKQTPEVSAPEPMPPQPVATITASNLFREYRENEVAADARYKEPYVEVYGILESINNDLLDRPYIVFRTTNTFSGIRCFFDATAKPLLARLQRGERFSVIGKCDGELAGDVILKGCRFGGNPPVGVDSAAPGTR